MRKKGSFNVLHYNSGFVTTSRMQYSLIIDYSRSFSAQEKSSKYQTTEQVTEFIWLRKFPCIEQFSPSVHHLQPLSRQKSCCAGNHYLIKSYNRECLHPKLIMKLPQGTPLCSALLHPVHRNHQPNINRCHRFKHRDRFPHRCPCGPSSTILTRSPSRSLWPTRLPPSP